MMLRSLNLKGSNVRVGVPSRRRECPGLAIKVLLAFASVAESRRPVAKTQQQPTTFIKPRAPSSLFLSNPYTLSFHHPPSSITSFSIFELVSSHERRVHLTTLRQPTPPFTHKHPSCLTAVVVTAARAAAVVTVAATATLAGTTTRDSTDKAPTATIQLVALTTGTILNKSLLSSACLLSLSTHRFSFNY